jgi:hypothetical protein
MSHSALLSILMITAIKDHCLMFGHDRDLAAIEVDPGLGLNWQDPLIQ